MPWSRFPLILVAASRSLCLPLFSPQVIISTLVLGGMTSPMLRRLKLVEEEPHSNESGGRTELELHLDHSGVVDGSEETSPAVARSAADRHDDDTHGALEMTQLRDAQHDNTAAASAIDHSDRVRFSDRRGSSSSSSGLHPHSSSSRHSHDEVEEDLGWVSRMWHRVDETYVQRVFGGAAHQRRFEDGHDDDTQQQRGQRRQRTQARSNNRGHSAASRVLAHPSEIQPIRLGRQDSATEEELYGHGHDADSSGLTVTALGRVVSAPPLRSAIAMPGLSFHSLHPDAPGSRPQVSGVGRVDSSRKARSGSSKLHASELALSQHDLEAAASMTTTTQQDDNEAKQSRFIPTSRFSAPLAPLPAVSPPPRVSLPPAPY